MRSDEFMPRCHLNAMDPMPMALGPARKPLPTVSAEESRAFALFTFKSTEHDPHIKEADCRKGSFIRLMQKRQWALRWEEPACIGDSFVQYAEAFRQEAMALKSWYVNTGSGYRECSMADCAVAVAQPKAEGKEAGQILCVSPAAKVGKHAAALKAIENVAEYRSYSREFLEAWGDFKTYR